MTQPGSAPAGTSQPRSAHVDGEAVATRRPDGPPTPDNRDYIAWLVAQSMLRDAIGLDRRLSGTGRMWRRPFGLPQPGSALRSASTWFTAYPPAHLTGDGRSVLAELASHDLWQALGALGIQAVHPGPVKISGGVHGWDHTTTVDGYFDRIGTQIDPDLGTVEDYRTLTAVAATHGAIVIDDLIPGHTGTGPDFQLATMAFGDYPGIYHIVQVDPVDWELLPEVPDGRETANLDVVAERALADAGYIVGPLQRVLMKAPGVKETNWSATRPVLGVDGVERRWVYLHHFKEGQPSINWIDPSFSGPRMVMGDALHSIV